MTPLVPRGFCLNYSIFRDKHDQNSRIYLARKVVSGKDVDQGRGLEESLETGVHKTCVAHVVETRLSGPGSATFHRVFGYILSHHLVNSEQLMSFLGRDLETRLRGSIQRRLRRSWSVGRCNGLM